MHCNHRVQPLRGTSETMGLPNILFTNYMVKCYAFHPLPLGNTLLGR
jgi:hypothetical protein